ncbi:MAG: SOS response-associated peptidase [Leptolyngbyaceae cyanobacterium CSU_1_3]|nr:SOS response-associated peptidase [Leptolyngbyaceae cyanobacterium CSU_1_3]
MCGRFTQSLTGEAIASAFDLAEIPPWVPRYNIAPTQMVPAILLHDTRQFQALRWGLIPSWAKDPTIGAKLINARSETVAEKPSFRSAFKKRRCLIVADGFYEWQKQAGKKQPFYFRLDQGQLFGFAGLWEQWQTPEGEVWQTCTILTTVGNDLLKMVHDRMPVILHEADYDRWLDPAQDPSVLQSLLRPYEADAMNAYPVSMGVNSPAKDTPDCMKPIKGTIPDN